MKNRSEWAIGRSERWREEWSDDKEQWRRTDLSRQLDDLNDLHEELRRLWGRSERKKKEGNPTVHDLHGCSSWFANYGAVHDLFFFFFFFFSFSSLWISSSSCTISTHWNSSLRDSSSTWNFYPHHWVKSWTRVFKIRDVSFPLSFAACQITKFF